MRLASTLRRPNRRHGAPRSEHQPGERRTPSARLARAGLHDPHPRRGAHQLADGPPVGRAPDHRALCRRGRPRAPRRHPRGPHRPCARCRAARSSRGPVEDLFDPAAARHRPRRCPTHESSPGVAASLPPRARSSASATATRASSRVRARRRGPHPERVRDIAVDGGTVLGTSRGPQDPEEIVDCLERLHVNVLFVVGGDGSMRGAMRIATDGRRAWPARSRSSACRRRSTTTSPTSTRASASRRRSARPATRSGPRTVEAKSTANGIGLVKLMGRHSGFIACYAALARAGADVVLIPEVPFALDGERGLLAHLRRRVAERGSATGRRRRGGWPGPRRTGGGERRLRQRAPPGHRPLPAAPHRRPLRRRGRRNLDPLHRSELRHPQRARQPLRLGVLRARSRRPPCTRR